MADVTKNMVIKVSQTGATEAAAGIAQVDRAQQGAAASADNLGKKTNSLTGFVREQRQENRQNNFLFKESRDVVTTLAFSMMALTSSVGGNNEAMKKLNQTMIMGFTGFQSAGFALSAFGFASGGLTTAISATVGIGMSLIMFLNDSEAQAKAAATSVDTFTKSLHNLTIEQLLQQQQGLEKRARDLESASGSTRASRFSFFGNSPWGRAAAGTLNKIIPDAATQQLELVNKEIEAVANALENLRETKTDEYIKKQADATKTAAEAQAKLNEEIEKMMKMFAVSGRGNIGYANAGFELIKGFEKISSGVKVPGKLKGVNVGMTERDWHDDLKKQAEIAPGSDFWYDTMKDFTRDFGMTLAQEGMNAMEKIFGRADSLLEKLLQQFVGGMMEKGGQMLGDYIMESLPLLLASRQPGGRGPSGGSTNVSIYAVDAHSISKMLSNPDNADAFAISIGDRVRKGKFSI